MRSKTSDPFYAQFFARISDDVAKSFSDAQLDAVKLAFGARSRGSHPIDIRMSIPLLTPRIYIVFLAGGEQRPSQRLALERVLRPVWTFANAVVIVGFVLAFIGSLGVGLYAGKRALGIDIIPGFDTLNDKKMEKILE